MPKITIEYEHPHELTDLLGKLMQMYVEPEPTCRDMPYPENYAQSESVGNCLGTITVGESVSVLEAKLKGAEQRELTTLENYNIVVGVNESLRKKLSEEHKTADKYHDVLNEIYDILIPKDANQHSLPVFTVEHRMNDFSALIEVLIADKKWNDEDMKDAWMAGINDGRDSADSFKFKTNTFNPSEWLSNYKKDDSHNKINSKDNTAFIANSDNQLFTLQEAAEYLEIEPINVITRVLDGRLKHQGFLLSDLRKYKEKLGK